MKFWLGWLMGVWWCSTAAWAAPVLLLPNELSAPGHGEIRLSYWSTEFNKRFDGSASASDLAAGETRRQTLIPMMARYALPGGEEILLQSSYADFSHKTST